MSEHIEEIVEVIARGLEVFEDKDRLIERLKQTNKALGGQTPLSMFDSRHGTELNCSSMNWVV